MKLSTIATIMESHHIEYFTDETDIHVKDIWTTPDGEINHVWVNVTTWRLNRIVKWLGY